MNFFTKYKFKQRFILCVVALLFMILLSTESLFLNYITSNVKNSRSYDVKETLQIRNEFDPDLKEIGEDFKQKTVIFEEILQNLDSHLSIMRRELSIKSNFSSKGSQGKIENTPFSDIKLPLEDVSDPKVKEVLANSKIIYKYADVFVKIADILKSGNKNERSKDIYHNVNNNADRIFEDIDENNPVANQHENPIFSAWPKLGVYNGNVSISNKIHPNGYMKREGINFELPGQTVKILQSYAANLRIHHRKRNSSDWDRLNLYNESRNMPAWKRWHNSISRHQLYPNDPKLVQEIINDLRTLGPWEIYEKPDAGTQFKLYVHFENKARALFKAIRFSREQEALPDQYYFSDYERFNAEIACFHLDRLLGFHRVPPTTGRIMNIQTEIEPNAVDGLEDNIMYSPAGNLCIRGRCDYFCDLHHMICGRPYLLEGSMMAYLPSTNDVDRKTWRHPWRRSYTVLESAKWEHDPKYCDKVRNKHPYNEGRRLLDLMDLSVLDFLTGNMDRHHYETLEPFGNDTFIVHYDNGKGFGNSREDEMTNLYPVMHCCLIRYTTFQKLLDFSQSPTKLGDAMRKSMQDDPVTPVLLEKHLIALDRRNNIILQEIFKCTEKLGYKNVIVDDGF